ncbi:MAG: RluA family pseudouridine synthase [Clostridia bacterium]|nr:RluA family pseudouridine synthase [Clostridia bacterium]
MQELTYVVPPEYDGQPAGHFLRRGCGLSWRMVVRVKNVPNGITADGVMRRTIDPVYAGQTVRLLLPEDRVKIEGVAAPLDVVFEDEHLLVVNKPPYLAVHPSAGKPEPTLANFVVYHYEAAGHPLSFRPVNRLDRNTSGLLLAAKNPHIAHALVGGVQKEYTAIVCGRLEGEGVIDQPIRVKEGCCITREVGEGGKESLTRWWTLAADDKASLLRVVIETGRTHQIRVHMSWLGYPLVGDTMYGTDQQIMTRHGLHCGQMAFTHPITGEKMTLTAPLPADMQAVADAIIKE